MPTRLFSPHAMRGLTLANRIVVSPMAQYSRGPGNEATDWHLMHYGNLAVSGPGLVILEATAVEPRGRVGQHDIGLWTDAQQAALARVLGFCRRHGRAAIGIQLAHAGRKASTARPWEGLAYQGEAEGGWIPVSGSDAPYPGRPVPRVLDGAGLEEVKQDFVAATRRAAAIGFDLVEVHAAHGYFLHSFLSPLSNTRNDAYGGDPAGRMRYPLEVIAAMRAAWPAEKPLGVRVSATDWMEGGWTVADTVAFARALKDLGCDYVCASSGGTHPDQRLDVGPGYQVPMARRIREDAGIPTMAVGLINEPQQAEQCLRDGAADLIALGRGMTYDPRWAWHAAEALRETAEFAPQYARSHPSMRFGDFTKLTPAAAAARRA
jgi:2,4-dienoyl-CoA reductase-like NADH-dependent reductase (Old Yellow Enzyme family)